jgi:REP element-mobilizing transposase RayT
MSSGIFNKYTGYHNRRSIRLRGYDYSQPGAYFVTICIHDRKQRLFGNVVDGKMVFNEMGNIAKKYWMEIPHHFPNVQLDEFIIMPNHVHGIIIIRDYDKNNVGENVGGHMVGVQNVELQKTTTTQNKYQHIIPRSIGSIIRGFKIGVTKMVRLQIPAMVVWQRNYFECIIRDQKSLYFIRKYIRENPLKWSTDSENHFSIEEKETTEYFTTSWLRRQKTMC